PGVMQYFSHAVQNGSMWARFGEVECISAPRRRTAGLVAVGIDRLIVPDGHDKKNFLGKDTAVRQNGRTLTTK
ncbi:MAG TPA: hypothetical protein VF988_08345, partial [Verrucomicrobiae bacterium]